MSHNPQEVFETATLDLLEASRFILLLGDPSFRICEKIVATEGREVTLRPMAARGDRPTVTICTLIFGRKFIFPGMG